MLTVLGSSLHGLSALHPRTKNTFLLCRSLHISLQSDRVSTSRWRIKEHRDLCGSRALVTPTPNMLEKQADSPRNSRAIKNLCEGGLLGCTCRSISLIIRCPLAYRERACSSSSYSSISLCAQRLALSTAYSSFLEQACRGVSHRQVLH